MKKVVKLYKKYEEIINYLIFGVLTTLVSLITKWGLLYTILDPTNSLELQISIIISWICSVSFAYVTNRLYVFKSENKGILKELVSFFGARLITLGIEMFIMWFFVTYLKMNSDIMVFIWTIATQFIIIVLNYIFSKLIVFRKKS